MFTKREFIIKLGENVRNIKSSKNITIITLAFNADIAFSQLSRVELGKISTSVFTLFKISKSFEVERKNIIPQ